MEIEHLGLNPLMELNDAVLTVGARETIDIRLQQRNGRKTITLIEGLPESFDLKKLLTHFKKTFSTNGTIQGSVMQLQGDQRQNVKGFLVRNKLCEENEIRLHGF